MKPMLARAYEYQDVTGWLMSEKLDGVRAIWTGSTLLSRNGKEFLAPTWFTGQLPAGVMLDGELYMDRGKLQQTTGIIRKKKPVDAEWRAIRYFVFDAPEAKGGFERRLAFCSALLEGNALVEVVKHEVCQGRAHLNDFFLGLVALRAEGVMLRRPGSAYEQRRSESLLKYKPFESSEAEVIGHQAGEGRYAGMLGALVCRWDGKTFNLGTGFSDPQREEPPRIGAQVSFLFQGLTDGGIPRSPVFLAERNYE